MADITLTSELLHSAASANRGWNRKQLAVLGVSWPPQKGWLSALVGRTVSAGVWEQFVALRGTTIRKVDLRRDDTPKKKFKTHDVLGRPLCRACGHNPRKPGVLICGRCARTGSPVQWDRIGDFQPPTEV